MKMHFKVERFKIGAIGLESFSIPAVNFTQEYPRNTNVIQSEHTKQDEKISNERAIYLQMNSQNQQNYQNKQNP